MKQNLCWSKLAEIKHLTLTITLLFINISWKYGFPILIIRTFAYKNVIFQNLNLFTSSTFYTFSTALIASTFFLNSFFGDFFNILGYFSKFFEFLSFFS